MHCVLRNKQRCLLSRITVDSLNLSRFFFFQLLSSGSFKHSSACPTVNTGTKQPIRHFYEWSTPGTALEAPFLKFSVKYEEQEQEREREREQEH